MFLLYLALFIIFNGKFTWEIFFIGLAVAAFMEYFSVKHLGYHPKRVLRALSKTPLIIKYIFILIAEIIKANVSVIKVIFSFAEEPEPAVVHFDSGLKTKTGNTVLANSITLTPGTITVNMEDDHFVVHALDKSMAEGIGGSTFVKQLEKMEKEGRK